jgi:hypothetical protein
MKKLKNYAMSYPKKTAFEQFLDDTFFLGGNNRNVIPKETIDYYLQIEKEQIEQAYDQGQENHYEYSEDNEVNHYDGEAYYHKKYVQPKLREQEIIEGNRRQREKWLKQKENELRKEKE